MHNTSSRPLQAFKTTSSVHKKDAHRIQETKPESLPCLQENNNPLERQSLDRRNQWGPTVTTIEGPDRMDSERLDKTWNISLKKAEQTLKQLPTQRFKNKRVAGQVMKNLFLSKNAQDTLEFYCQAQPHSPNLHLASLSFSEQGRRGDMTFGECNYNKNNKEEFTKKAATLHQWEEPCLNWSMDTDLILPYTQQVNGMTLYFGMTKETAQCTASKDWPDD
eukprot:jgi/Psemu1/62048/gm1.62048_g